MELFTDSGHLTDMALQAAIAETLDEMGRLEVAEHLSFCDACLVRYTDMLTDETLIAPAAPLRPRIVTRWKKKIIAFALSRYGTVAAAVAIGMAMWSTGIFSNAIEITQPTKPTGAAAGIAQQVNGFFGNMADNINGVFGAITFAGENSGNQQTTLEKEIARAALRRQKEAESFAAKRQAAEKEAAERKAKEDAAFAEKMAAEDAKKFADTEAKNAALARDAEKLKQLKNSTAENGK